MTHLPWLSRTLPTARQQIFRDTLGLFFLFYHENVYFVCSLESPKRAILITLNIPLFYRSSKRHPYIIPILSPTLILILSGSNCLYLEKNFHDPKDVRAIEVPLKYGSQQTTAVFTYTLDAKIFCRYGAFCAESYLHLEGHRFESPNPVLSFAASCSCHYENMPILPPKNENFLIKKF